MQFYLSTVFNHYFPGHKVNSQSRRPSTIARSLGVNPKSVVSTSQHDAFECPEEFGYYPHPADCSQYYVCVFGGALLESCTGGLMYSHELQTCDWPRNVGCEVSEETASVTGRDVQRETPDAFQLVPSKFRFSSLTSPRPISHPTQTERIQESTVRIQTQQSFPPPPPELRVAPNPVITSRGQPKPFDSIDIAKVDILKLNI